MNLQEFIQTLEYSLNTIEVSGSQEIYEVLFREVDLDDDGFISYEDFFIFLKEYFGSLSAIYDDNQ
jgi:Ca2+-binding EF-hand superfamily protein